MNIYLIDDIFAKMSQGLVKMSRNLINISTYAKFQYDVEIHNFTS